jgi:hypothetical protein
VCICVFVCVCVCVCEGEKEREREKGKTRRSGLMGEGVRERETVFKKDTTAVRERHSEPSVIKLFTVVIYECLY